VPAPELDPRDRSAAEAFVADLRETHGDALLAVALTGEVASEAYRPRKTPLESVILLDAVTPEALRRTRAHLRRWDRRRIPTPLVLDPRYVESALDVFPLEFLEISDHHLLLHGDRDPFADLPVDLAHLRLQVEEQLRGKLLHLWEAYLAVGSSKRRLRRLLLETPPGFAMILRGLLRLWQGEDAGVRRPDGDALLAAVEARLGTSLPVFRRLLAAHRGDGSLDRGELDRVFEGYLEEVRALVRTSDRS